MISQSAIVETLVIDSLLELKTALLVKTLIELTIATVDLSLDHKLQDMHLLPLMITIKEHRLMTLAGMLIVDLVVTLELIKVETIVTTQDTLNNANKESMIDMSNKVMTPTHLLPVNQGMNSVGLIIETLSAMCLPAMMTDVTLT